MSAPPEKRSRNPTAPPLPFAADFFNARIALKVDVRDGYVRPEPEDRDDEDREQDLVPKVRDPEHVPQAGDTIHTATTFWLAAVPQSLYYDKHC